MKNIFVVLFFVLVNITSMWAQRIKVACVGNSITYGAGITNREKNSYPAQLQQYLGDKFEVKNFGRSGTTALQSGDYPYVKTAEHRAAMNFQPDIVLIKLGTNDTKPHNWDKDKFVSDYQSIIETYRSLKSHPRIILLTPIRCFLTSKNTISPTIIEQEVRPVVEELAWKNGLDIVNLYNLYGDRWQERIMPDRLHPSAAGAQLIARKTGDYILHMTSEDSLAEVDLCTNDTVPFNFHGFRGVDFQVGDMQCKIVKPWVAAKGRPWVLRARFWGHEPQVDIDLLERGFHIAYCDVANLYGSDKAIKRWNRFYKWMTGRGFNEKVVLEGMSRGGLIVYNWAAKNTKKVACIYADAPVMDIKSWPMGKGASKGSEPDCRLMYQAYGFRSVAQAQAWKKNPIDHARKLAQAKIPIIHVVGDDDNVVPYTENTAIFEAMMNSYGVPITVVHKPGVGHHPHSLNNPEKIVNFILGVYTP